MDLSLVGVTASPEVIALITFLCIGGVKLVDTLFARDFASASKIVVSVVLGAVFGFVTTQVDVITGMAIGLSASGLITTISRMGRDNGSSAVG